MPRRKIIPYHPKLKPLAKQLRKNSTQAEVMLWQSLKGKQILGNDFDRQRRIDNYIVDFYCKDLLLAIEIDGESHNEKTEYDRQRQASLENWGGTVLQFYDWGVKEDAYAVAKRIENGIRQNRKK
ncbi:MAG: endonuclease domain-containing protein [candidate division KSB1 bacterium]|nr:endonuclease domain-containing protein [candidate division KSB1 bacterium]MDQ7064744.1 endonuclease domain-containing protein [candidate division KSB1 bacterium]